MIRVLSIALTISILVAILVFAGWLFVRGIRRSEDPPKMIMKWIITFLLGGFFLFGVVRQVGYNVGGAFIVPFVCVFLGVVMSILWVPHLGAWMARPITSLFDGGDSDWKPEPLYSMTIARRKQGRFQEAVAEVRKQLDQFPNDYAGQVLLAEIQADDLKDLPAAELTLERLLLQPGHPPNHIAYALNLLADWHLKYRQDPDTARLFLERISARLPDSVEAQMAAQRIAHLASHESLMESVERTPIQLRTGVDNIGLLKDSSHLARVEKDPAVIAAECVAHLEEHPLDTEVREKLALIYAEHYQRADLAIEQLNQLVELPHQTVKHVTRWLNLMADLQLKQLHDLEAARRSLERIIDLYPAWACAAHARQRLDHLRLEVKGSTKAEGIKLGSYEQNLGLKSQPPTVSEKRSPRG